MARFGTADGPSCGRCADFPTPESCYRTPDAPADPNRVWASAQSCIQRCHNRGCVPLDCRYLGSRDFPWTTASNNPDRYETCERYYDAGTVRAAPANERTPARAPACHFPCASAAASRKAA